MARPVAAPRAQQRCPHRKQGELGLPISLQTGRPAPVMCFSPAQNKGWGAGIGYPQISAVYGLIFNAQLLCAFLPLGGLRRPALGIITPLGAGCKAARRR